MNTQKKILFLVSFFASSSSVYATQYIESYDQLKNYVEQVVANFFYPKHEWNEIKQLQRNVVSKVNYNYNLGFFTYYYEQERVYQAVVDESINFVVYKAYYLKGERARTAIRKEIMDRVSRMSEIPLGFLADYIGQALNEKLEHLNYAQPVQPEKLYPSTECCVCYQDFDGSIEQVFLIPCGHDLCRDCCKSHFFTFNNSYCPKCRAKVNKDRLSEIVFATSSALRGWFD